MAKERTLFVSTEHISPEVAASFDETIDRMSASGKLTHQAGTVLPEGHEAVAVFLSKDEAREEARRLLYISPRPYRFYIQDRRGAWEVIRYTA